MPLGLEIWRFGLFLPGRSARHATMESRDGGSTQFGVPDDGAAFATSVV
jgi:hypothetical protein